MLLSVLHPTTQGFWVRPGPGFHFPLGAADECSCLQSGVYWRDKSLWLNMNHAEETKELLSNEGGLPRAQQQKAELQLRRDGKPGSKRPLTGPCTRNGPGCWDLRGK